MVAVEATPASYAQRLVVFLIQVGQVLTQCPGLPVRPALNHVLPLIAAVEDTAAVVAAAMATTTITMAIFKTITNSQDQ
jgi:hypothetical protein